MNPPGFRHGEVCSNIHHHVDNFVRKHRLGRTLSTRKSTLFAVVDPQFQTVNVHYPDRPVEKLYGEDPLVFTELPGFSLPVRLFFE